MVVVLRRAGAGRRRSARSDEAAVSGRPAPVIRWAAVIALALVPAASASQQTAVILAAVSGFSGTAIEAQQAAPFTAKVEAVRVDALVTNDGKPVLGLGPSDFEVTDNGVSQQVDLV